MPRVVRVFALEEIGMLNEPIFSTPLGSVSLRQGIYLAISLIGAWFMYNTVYGLTRDNVLAAPFVLTPIVVGMVLAFKRVKSFPIEVQLYRAIFKPKKGRAAVKAEARPKQVEKAPEEEIMFQTVDMESVAPIKISGTLRDPFTKAKMRSAEFQVYVGDKLYSEKYLVTDADGGYVFYFVPEGAGEYEIKFVPKGYSVPAEVVRLKVSM
jgi:hypothetical protein